MSDISATGASTTTNPLQPTATLPAGDTAVAGGGSGAGTSTLNGVNSDTFLKLLISQLENQDPDNPTDPTQFLSETADFEEVQQLSAISTSMTSLVGAQQSSAATSMLGMQVTGSDASGNPVSGIVSGVQLTSSGPVLTVGKDSVPYSAVTGITIPRLIYQHRELDNRYGRNRELDNWDRLNRDRLNRDRINRDGLNRYRINRDGLELTRPTTTRPTDHQPT